MAPVCTENPKPAHNGEVRQGLCVNVTQNDAYRLKITLGMGATDIR